MKRFLPLFLLILLSIPSILPFLHPGFFVSDDGEWMVIRFSAFYQALVDGQFPVRFLGRLNYGYGYPVANFLYPGFMYAAVPIHLLGFGFVDTIKVLLALSMVGSAIFCFLWLSKLFDRFSSFVGALFYLYTPYHLYDLYKRGSVGEVLALAVVPFILWQIERGSFFWGSISIATLILFHNTLALLFLPIIATYMVIKVWNSPKRLTQIYQYTSILVIAVGLAAFFWIPALFELSLTRFSEIIVSDFTKYFSPVELIGFSSLIVLVISIFLFFKVRPWSRSHLSNSLIVLFLVLAILDTLFSTKITSSLWNLLPSSFIQFPFRLLSFLVLSTAFLGAYVTSHFIGFRRYIISIILVVLLFFSVRAYLEPSGFFDKGDAFYSTNEATTTVQDEYMPHWVRSKPVDRYKNKVEIVEGKGKIKNLFFNASQRVKFDVNAETDLKVRVNTIYYPGWKAYVDPSTGSGQVELKIDYSNELGVMELDLKKGSSKVEFLFGETPLRLFADAISILSLIVLGVLSFKRRVLYNTS